MEEVRLRLWDSERKSANVIEFGGTEVYYEAPVKD